MNHCVRLLLLFTPSLIGLGLLGIAFATDWWIIALERNISHENYLNISDTERVHSTLIRVPLSRGLLTECTAYRNVKVLISDEFDFREKSLHEENIKLANENCTMDQFTCLTGVTIRNSSTRCIYRQQKCNRVIDCEDKSDEVSCTDNFNTNEFYNCPTGYDKCQDGKSCYRQNETCDGISNCFDGSDEKNCNLEKCQRNKRVYCPREGKCSRRENSQRCDGIVDCADNSDEERCSRCYGSSSTILCDSKCVLGKYHCDGIGHCSDLRDEDNCKNDAITLNGRKKKFL